MKEWIIELIVPKYYVFLSDKWNPGDIYIQIGSVTLPDSKEIQDWNNLFVKNWGDTEAPLVSISLK